MVEIVGNLLGNLMNPGMDDGESTIVDPVIRVALNILIQKFGYANVNRVMKTLKPKKVK